MSRRTIAECCQILGFNFIATSTDGKIKSIAHTPHYIVIQDGIEYPELHAWLEALSEFYLANSFPLTDGAHK